MNREDNEVENAGGGISLDISIDIPIKDVQSILEDLAEMILPNSTSIGDDEEILMENVVQSAIGDVGEWVVSRDNVPP